MHKFIRWLIDPPGRAVRINETAGRFAKKDLTDLDWLYPPSDVHAAEPWDTWWRGRSNTASRPAGPTCSATTTRCSTRLNPAG